MGEDPLKTSIELWEIAEFVEYIERKVSESETGLSPSSIRQIKEKYLELRMKAEIDIKNVPTFMRSTSFKKMKELDALDLRLETVLQLAADKYKLYEMKISCEELQKAVITYKTLVYVLASALAAILGAIVAKTFLW
ncbi:MAG: hypothetical protein J7L37_04995 [Thermococcus sp.]|nr:hypothetical protein [Thermococcus sp.]